MEQHLNDLCVQWNQPAENVKHALEARAWNAWHIPLHLPNTREFV